MNQILEGLKGAKDGLSESIKNGLAGVNREVLDGFKINVLDKFNLDAISYEPKDFENGVLNADMLGKFKEDAKKKLEGIDWKIVEGLIVAQAGFLGRALNLSDGGEDKNALIEWLAANASERLKGLVEAKVKEAPNFTKVIVEPKDFLQFAVTVEKPAEVGADVKAVGEKSPEVVQEVPVESPEDKIAIEKEKTDMLGALKSIGPLGMLAAHVLGGERTDEKGNKTGSFLDQAFANSESPIAIFLGALGFPRFIKAYETSAAQWPQEGKMGEFTAKIKGLANDWRPKIQAKLKLKNGSAEAVVKGLGVTEFMDRLKKGDEEFKGGLKTELVVGDEWKVNGQANIVLPEGAVLKIPAGGEYGVTIDGEWKSNTPSADYDLNGGADKSLVVAQLPEGTIIPVGSKIISLMKEEPAVA